jgi:hypothetical protein
MSAKDPTSRAYPLIDGGHACRFAGAGESRKGMEKNNLRRIRYARNRMWNRKEVGIEDL